MGRLVEMIALLTSVVFIMMAYRDTMLPPVDKNYTLEIQPDQQFDLDVTCGKELNCTQGLK
jgi:hypothetical protein